MVYKYCRLTHGERYQIELLLRRGEGIRAIARSLKRSPSTISEEVRGRPNLYKAESSHHLTQKRRRSWQGKRCKIQGELQQIIIHGLKKLHLSPEQICRRLEAERKEKLLSAQTIYRFIEKDKKNGGILSKSLRILRQEWHNRKKPTWHKREAALPKRKMIDQRPLIVEKRTRLGDYERDLVLGKVNGSSLLTIVDRKSRLVRLGWMKKKNAKIVHDLTVSLLRNEVVRTITNDNGGEFARHPETAEELKTKIYFSRAYRAWERGTNENLNGLLRQYFPKKHDIGYVSPRRLREIENLLNHRPRKCLGFKTPYEVHHKIRRQLFG